MKPTYILCKCGLYHPTDCPRHPVTRIPWLRFTKDELDGMWGKDGWICVE